MPTSSAYWAKYSLKLTSWRGDGFVWTVRSHYEHDNSYFCCVWPTVVAKDIHRLCWWFDDCIEETIVNCRSVAFGVFVFSRAEKSWAPVCGCKCERWYWFRSWLSRCVHFTVYLDIPQGCFCLLKTSPKLSRFNFAVPFVVEIGITAMSSQNTNLSHVSDLYITHACIDPSLQYLFRE